MKSKDAFYITSGLIALVSLKRYLYNHRSELFNSAKFEVSWMF